jgi:mRNA deadenylase 3'-5' endonuclease subunit Ccr4
MAAGCLEQHHPELDQSDDLLILPPVQDIAHDLELASAMQTGLGSEPLFTNFTANFKGTLDYIWYTPGRLRLLAVTNFPDPASLVEQCGEGLPGASYPSDHVMLCSDMAFALTGSGTVTRSGIQRRGIPSRVDKGKYGVGAPSRNGNTIGTGR